MDLHVLYVHVVGASALVFKCQWPSRFGPNALLAGKVLRDPYDPLPDHIQVGVYSQGYVCIM
jgi:hypothetical protein